MKSGDHQFDPGREQYIPAGYFPFLKRSFYRLLGPMVELDLSITSAVKFVWVCNIFSWNEITDLNPLWSTLSSEYPASHDCRIVNKYNMLSGSIIRNDNRGCRMNCSDPCMVAGLPAQIPLRCNPSMNRTTKSLAEFSWLEVQGYEFRAQN